MISSLGQVFEAAGELRTAEGLSAIWCHLPDAVWVQSAEGGVLRARSWKTLLNDPHIQAIAFTLDAQILGDGLWYRSRFGPGQDQDRPVQTIRTLINEDVAVSRTGCRLDAGSWLTAADIDTQLLLAGFFGGNAWAVRHWKPNRPTTDRGVCWRVVDGSRVETPQRLASDRSVVNGVRYRDEVPFSIFVRRLDAGASARLIVPPPEYDEIEIWDKAGFRQVVHYAPMRWGSGSDLGFPALSAGLVLAHQLRQLMQAHLTGKRIQASHPIAVEVANPAEAAKKYQEAVDAGQADADAQILFLPKGASPKFSNAAYNGADLEAVSNVYLRSLTAGIGYAWQLCLQQLTNSNMASSQAALDLAERSNAKWQRGWIEQVQSHVDYNTIREGWARGAYGDIPWSSQLLAGDWQRPRRSDANRLRSRQAALIEKQLGFSMSTIHDQLGSDFNREQERLTEDRRTSARTGNPFPPALDDSGALIAALTTSGAGDEPTPAPPSGTDPAPEGQPQQEPEP